MLSQLIFSSTALCSAAEAKSLCMQFGPANADRQITSVLLLSHGTFLQYLEGDEFMLATTFNRIRLDHRHTNCKVLDARLISLRAFKTWSMEWLLDSAAADPRMQAIVDRHVLLPSVTAKTAAALFRDVSKAVKPT